MQSPPPSLRVFEHGVAGDARRGGGVRHVAAVFFQHLPNMQAGHVG